MIPQYQYKRKIEVGWEKIILPVLLSSLLVLTCYQLLLLKNTHPGKILQSALHHMEQNRACLGLDIQEKGPGYEMAFLGSFANNAMQGRFPAYELEIYKDSSGELYVKDLKDGSWKKAAGLELQALEDFFVSPFTLLTAWSHLFRNARFVHPAEEQGKGKTILLPVPALEAEKTALLQNYSRGSISRLECLIFLEPDSLFVNRIVFSLQDERSASVIKRTITLKDTGENDAGIVPAGMEQLLERHAL